jgi:hypothetical protein
VATTTQPEPTGTTNADETKPDAVDETADDTPAQPAARASRLARWGIPALLAIAGAALIAAGIALTWNSEDEKPPPYTVPVAYQVTGNGRADITYLDNVKVGQEKNTSYGHQHAARLPWHASAHVTPDSGPATVTVQLGKKGGHASCRIAVRGREIQMASASGSYGRAVCTADVPARER